MAKTFWNVEKVIKKAFVEFCPEVHQKFLGKKITDKMLSLKFKEIKKWTEFLYSALYKFDFDLWCVIVDGVSSI